MSPILSSLFSVQDLHKNVIDTLAQFRNMVVSGVGTPLSKAFFLQDIFAHIPQKNMYFVMHNKNEIAEYEASFQLFFPEESFSILDKADKELELQKRILDFIENFHVSKNQKEKKIYLATTDFLFQYVPSKHELSSEIYTIQKQDELILSHVCEQFITMGYKVSQDRHLEMGTYRVEGGSIHIYPVNNSNLTYKIELFGSTVDQIVLWDQDKNEVVKILNQLEIYPLQFKKKTSRLIDYIQEKSCIITDELDLQNEEYFQYVQKIPEYVKSISILKITSFPDERDVFENLRYLSVIKYYATADFINDLKDRSLLGYKIVILTKNKDDILGMLEEYNMKFSENSDFFHEYNQGILVLPLHDKHAIPRSFQNTHSKIVILTDREIFRVRKKENASYQKSVFDFITSLTPGDFVVHSDHGIGRFLGIEKKVVDGITKEYIQIQYAGNDRLFIPTDQAGKLSRFIAGDEENAPKLTKLDSGEWASVNRKVKEETKKIAKELLQIYAKRKLSKRDSYGEDTKEQKIFEETFQYDETPGQMKAIKEVKDDMEKTLPMDRLVCGDVGFGKTEVALRAAFKAVRDGRQVALISPVTILADQHYKSFSKRMKDFNIRLEMLSRFRTLKQQKEIIEKLKKGEIDIIIGTHRLLQDDVEFKNLGLVIVDEEQKFGVKQKEKIKKFRANIDILTLSATPIPRTLNMSLNKLRDITIITTPPPGRLPIITEVRKYNEQLVKDAISYELARGGQVYFLHNKVQTIESMADKLRFLLPHVRFVVGHGQLDSKVLEERIMDFKEKKYDVLVSSTIIENGIDLSNANTLIVNNADMFGLAQLYQLRGRVGRSKTQAYTYLLYHGDRLSLEAKKRLRAIVEASELGSGFQIAMKDLEIRGAGDILGLSQHGVVKSVGVSHFVRMLNESVEEMKAGKISDDIEMTPEQNVTVELPLTSFIPENYISDYKEKISIYQKMSSVETMNELLELKQNVQDEYGTLPEEVRNLFKVLEIKMLAKEAHLVSVRIVNYTLNEKYLELHMSSKVSPYQIATLLQSDTEHAWLISGDKLKINVRKLGLHVYDGIQKGLKLLIEGKKLEKTPVTKS